MLWEWEFMVTPGWWRRLFSRSGRSCNEHSHTEMSLHSFFSCCLPFCQLKISPKWLHNLTSSSSPSNSFLYIVFPGRPGRPAFIMTHLFLKWLSVIGLSTGATSNWDDVGRLLPKFIFSFSCVYGFETNSACRKRAGIRKYYQRRRPKRQIWTTPGTIKKKFIDLLAFSATQFYKFVKFHPQ